MIHDKKPNDGQAPSAKQLHIRSSANVSNLSQRDTS